MNYHFVTGATGFIGRTLVRNLIDQGDTVWILSREPQKARLVFSEVASELLFVIEGDITKPNLAISDFRPFEKKQITVWHLAANLSFQPKDKDLVFKTNVQGTKNIVDFTHKSNAKLCYMSTAFVCGDFKGKITETFFAKTYPRNNYEASKFEAEKIIMESNITFKIFRPSIVIGDAYEGKAEGCTFGYYRFAFVFYIFKKWIIKKLKEKSFAGWVLKKMKTQHDPKSETLIAPWMKVFVPHDTTVNLIPLDCVIQSIISIWKAWPHQKIFHLTNNAPLSVSAGTNSLLEDINISGFSVKEISPISFSLLIKSGYYLLFPLRKYFISAMWYLPYTTKNDQFETKNSGPFLDQDKNKITRNFLKKINRYAVMSIFPNIKL